jgi:acyl-CoA hydrolase
LFTIHKNPKGKKASESKIDAEKINFFDEHSSLDEFIFGGRILNLVNNIALKTANKHADVSCHTISIDFVRYYSQIKRGDYLVCKAIVNRVWDNIIEVGAQVIAEDLRSLEIKKILSAYFLFKADVMENSFEIPQVIPETVVEKRRFIDAEKRRKIREKRKK